MARTTVTEESLGLSPTEDELSTSVAHPDDADIPLNDEETPVPELAKPGDDKDKPRAEDPPAQAKPEGEQPKAEEPKMVDVRAVQEARAEARAAKQQAAVLEQRWNDFLAYSQQPKAQEQPSTPAVPDVDDPQAVLAWAREQIIAQQEAARTETTQRQQQDAQQQAFQRAFDHVNADYTASSKEDPTILDAHQALRQSLGAELLAMGYSAADASREVTKLENQHLIYVAQNGLKIGDHIKNMATARGWKPPAQQAPAPKTDLAAVAAAQQRHQSLSDAPGGETVPVLDAKALGRMSDKEFKAWMSKKGNEAKFDEIMGR